MPTTVQQFEYTTIAVKVTGASGGVFSVFQSKGIDAESFSQLERMGRMGWKLVSVIPVTTGVMGASGTNVAICFLTRAIGSWSLPTIPASEPIDVTLLPAPRSDTISREHFNLMLARDRLKRQCESTDYRLTEEQWMLVTSNRAPEAIPAVERLIHAVSADCANEIQPRLEAFYGNLRPAEASESLYKLAEDSSCFPTILKIISSLGLLDVEKIKVMLNAKKRDIQLNAVMLLWLQKPQYAAEDAREFDELATAVIAAFPSAVVFEKKGILSRAKQVWKCLNCGSENETAAEKCTCGTDKYGVTAAHGGRENILERLERRKKVLQSCVSDS